MLGLTKEGKRFVLATILIALAAFNTGNNLTYLILAMMLSVLSIAAVAPLFNLSGLGLRVSVSQPVFAGQRAVLDITVKNAKKHLPAYSLRLRMPAALGGEGYIPFASARSEMPGCAEFSAKRRGKLSYGDFIVESSFPFIFFKKELKVQVEGSLTVYPGLMGTEGAEFIFGPGGGVSAKRHHGGDEFLTLRDFIQGDDMRLVHWKASAKGGRLVAKEFAAREGKKVSLILDDGRPFDGEAFEKAVSFAASAALKLAEEGFEVGLVTSKRQLPAAPGAEQLWTVLDLLAEVREEEGASQKKEDALRKGEEKGARIFVLKSEGSPLRFMVSSSDIVVYAPAL